MSSGRYNIKISRWLTVMTLVGLALGLLAGLNYSYVSRLAWVSNVLELIEGIGFIWVNLLQLIAIPLIVFLIWDALSVKMDRNLGKMGFMTLILFIFTLIVGSIYIVLIIHPVLNFIPRPEFFQVEELKRSMSFESGEGDSPQWKQFFHHVFNNEILTFLKRKLWIWLLLPVLMTFGPPLISFKQPLSSQKIEDVLNYIFKIISWLLQLVPVAVMGLTFTFTRSLGYSLSGVIIYLILGGCAVISLFIVIQLVCLVLIGGIGFRTLFQVVKNPYLVAMSSRSSLATLPVLAKETDRFLHLRSDVTGFVFPFSATFLKITSPVSQGFKLFFIAHIFYIDLGWPAILIFFLSNLFIAFLTQGIPTEGNAGKSMPLFIATGVPAEGFILTRSFFTIPDIFETVSNVTGYLLVTVLIHRMQNIYLPGHTLTAMK